MLREIKPDLILLRMTGYGQEGPYSRKPGFGTALEAYCGAVYINGYPDRPPLLPGFGLADMSSGMAGAFLAMVALRERDARSGQGQVIDLALYETLFTMLAPIVSDYDQLGIVQERNGSRFTWVTPRNVYETRDGKFVAISGGSQAVFERLCGALGIPEAGKDPRFCDTPTRSKNADALDDILKNAVAGFDRDDLARIEAAQAVVAPIRSIAEIVEDPQIVARESIVTVEDETLGPLKMQNVIGRFSRTPGSVRTSAPKCGQDNAEILIERLGFTPEELDRAGVAYELRPS